MFPATGSIFSMRNVALASVSVVIPHYGDAAPTRRLVEQLRNQHDAPAQIIVVDDASPEPYEGDGDDLIRRSVNGGFGTAVNTGVAAAREPWLLILNSDVEIGTEVVGDLLRAAAEYPDALLAPRVLHPSGAVATSTRLFPTLRSQLIEALDPIGAFRYAPWYVRRAGLDPRCRSAKAPLTDVDWCTGEALLLLTDTFRSVGGFDEGFFMYFEETDLQRRLARLGCRRVYLPSVVVTHEGGGSTDPARVEGWMMASRFRYAGRWGLPHLLAVGLLSVALVNLGFDAIRSLKGRPRKPWQQFRARVTQIRSAHRRLLDHV